MPVGGKKNKSPRCLEDIFSRQETGHCWTVMIKKCYHFLTEFTFQTLCFWQLTLDL